MPNPSLSNQPQCSSNSPCRSAIPTLELYQAGYQQALIDFAIIDLLQSINAYSDAHFKAAWVALTIPETETLAATLIQSLIANLNGNLLATYLDAIRQGPLDAFTPLTKLHLPPPTTNLPATFPDVEMPRFLYGDRLCWTTHNGPTDWGTVIGRFYSFAPHCCRWHWCYLIWLAPESPSAAWVRADIAWEDDLEPLETALVQ